MDVVELRRYALKPGRRDDLIDLFEREFIESQEECGIALLGYYRDLDDPNAFVWFRGFEGMEQRREALEAFYVRSSAWRHNRDAANETMVDSDNVLLLRPMRAIDESRAARTSHAAVSIFMLPAAADEQYIGTFERELLPQLRQIAQDVTCFVTEPHVNTFPRLPVREGEWAFVVSGTCADNDAIDAWHRICPAPESLRLTGTSFRR